ncbi:uncharacterized protein Z520_01853 [Fonsecaea multimorphosa CBS 102226]|uniref:Uncharacterized protein n=1 Tax=Fonsecaea multimorphosa CBS 102226 TaxID=1442371 RepID=A0A0D2KEE1_9EURO|nr:uncharacterized protein Z520_01853 [Fonsecaea multimorphosa CBS 102226]KIY01715.1 hypothetical protein Z520_01853 [Fonsecaea multimorphosa CBS 102226]OAL29909.1 hypothetical protein AYO22_01815 [Fonsecaea multimorphosa]
MDRGDILDVLSSEPENERPQTRVLRRQAHSIISDIPSDVDQEGLPTALLELLTQIIKPLFTNTKHPQLTSTGRKSLVPGPPPSIATSRFLSPLDDDEQEAIQKPWKRTPFTVPLLKYILQSYALLPKPAQKSTIESHFHFLVPPVLNMIDDASAQYKSDGCLLLRLLCTTLISAQSDMLRRTGLTDVFVDALKTNFLLLPTLTPEEDSLLILRELYPAYLALVDARFVNLQVAMTEGVDISTGKKTDAGGATWTIGEDFTLREALLTKLYRHGIMASLSHLSSSTSSFSNTISAPLTTFLLKQIPPVFRRLNIHAVKHLQTLLPMMRVALMDPFVLAAPEMALASLNVLAVVVQRCSERVRDKWWPEILRACVACWCNCLDEKEGANEGAATALQEVMDRAKGVVELLQDALGEEEWEDVKAKLLQEEKDLIGLFED